jgi:hypothetical protein
MWYIGTLEEVSAYNTKVNEVKQYKGSITSNWANPRPHPDGSKWAIIAHATEPDEKSGLTLIEELTPDWYPTEEE